MGVFFNIILWFKDFNYGSGTITRTIVEDGRCHALTPVSLMYTPSLVHNTLTTVRDVEHCKAHLRVNNEVLCNLLSLALISTT